MKVRVLRPHLGANNRVIQEGTIIDVSEVRAREMETSKIGVPLVGRLGNEKGGATAGAERPTKTPPAGGKTGAVKPALLSPPAQVPQKQKSAKRRGSRA